MKADKPRLVRGVAAAEGNRENVSFTQRYLFDNNNNNNNRLVQIMDAMLLLLVLLKGELFPADACVSSQ